jgi:hypothetical protein
MQTTDLRAGVRLRPLTSRRSPSVESGASTMTAEGDTAMIARQLAELTRTVEDMAGQLKAVRDRADNQQERADTQQERIDLAARELVEVSSRLQAAAAALRESI